MWKKQEYIKNILSKVKNLWHFYDGYLSDYLLN